ncbi:aminotransferase-like domain-containing protein [Thalassotalea fusca]
MWVQIQFAAYLKGTVVGLYQAFADEIVLKIKQKQYVSGDRLPSIRRFAAQKQVSVNTAVSCYRLLEQLGFVEAKDKSGYVVLPYLADSGMPLPKFASKRVELHAEHEVNPQVARHPFERAQASPELLPTESLTKSMTNVVRKNAKCAYVYGDVQGELRLRQSLSQHFKPQGFSFSAEQLVINNGCLDSIKLALEITTAPGDSVAVSSPCFNGLLAMLAMMKRAVVEVPSNSQGVDLKQIESLMANKQIAACLFTANHQNPQGTSFPIEQKQALAKLSNRYEIPIIEDDVYQELHFGRVLPLPIKAFDQMGTVIWCSSISKTLASGYRIGWALPGKYLAEFIQRRVVQSLGVNVPLQLAVSDFIEKNYYQRHLKKLRLKLAQQMAQYRQIIIAQLGELPNVHISEPTGGLTLWVYVNGLAADKLMMTARNQNIEIRAGNLFSTRGFYNSYFRINVGFPLDDSLTKQLKQVCHLVNEQCAGE